VTSQRKSNPDRSMSYQTAEESDVTRAAVIFLSNAQPVDVRHRRPGLPCFGTNCWQSTVFSCSRGGGFVDVDVSPLPNDHSNEKAV